MPKLPVISGKKLLKILKRNGFYEVRQKGSHVFVADKSNEISTIIPLHGNEDLGRGLLRSILEDLQITTEELIQMLRK